MKHIAKFERSVTSLRSAGRNITDEEVVEFFLLTIPSK